MLSTIERIGETASHAAVEATWAQWSALTTLAVRSGARKPKSIIDPEALILMSLVLRDEERRLLDLVGAWARSGSNLLSAQRMRSLARTYPSRAHQGVREFAALAKAGGDKRWRSLADDVDPASVNVRKKTLGATNLLNGPALTFRLRAGFGVGAKADVLSFLLGLHHAGASLRVMELATGYAARTLRDAVTEMEAAGLVHRIDASPAGFTVPLRPWILVLEGHRMGGKSAPSPTVPPWRYWSVIYSFLAGVIQWREEAKQLDWSPYIASSRARDLVEAHAPGLRRTRVAVPDSRSSTGADYLADFEALVKEIGRWTEES